MKNLFSLGPYRSSPVESTTQKPVDKVREARNSGRAQVVQKLYNEALDYFEKRAKFDGSVSATFAAYGTPHDLLQSVADRLYRDGFRNVKVSSQGIYADWSE